MTLFLLADLHDTAQQERGLISAFEHSLIDDPYHYLVTDGQAHLEAHVLQLNSSKADLVVKRFLAADKSYIGTANQKICAPHFATVSAESQGRAILWEYISASAFNTNLQSFNPTSFEIYCCADRFFRATPTIQSVLVPLPIVRRDDLEMDITYREEAENVILARS